MLKTLEHFPTKDRLHTDVLEDKYGPIHSVVLRHDDSIREVHLCDEKEISRTYALTFLTYDNTDTEIAEIDSIIKSGGMIGKTFREFGYSIRKNVVEVFILPLTKEIKTRFNTDKDLAKARISEFYARKASKEPIIYGIVLEVYSPDFREPVINEVDISQVKPLTHLLEKEGITKEQIWNSLEEGKEANIDSNFIKIVNEIREKGQEEVNIYKKKILNYLDKYS